MCLERYSNRYQSSLSRTKADEVIDVDTGERFELRRKPDGDPFLGFLGGLGIGGLLLLLLL